MIRYYLPLITILLLAGCASQQKVSEEITVIRTTPENGTRKMEIEFTRGQSFNHPSFAVWTEDLEGNYIETLYVTRYVAKGNYAHGEISPGQWKNEPGNLRRPATLPYWAHKRNIKAPDGLMIPSPETAIPDAITAATPKSNFRIETATQIQSSKKYRLLFEINQAWDSNLFWTNNKFPGDNDYFGSLQPALVYAVTIDPGSGETEFFLNPIGHSHPSGKTGQLFTNLTTLTTAKEIAANIVVRLK